MIGRRGHGIVVIRVHVNLIDQARKFVAHVRVPAPRLNGDQERHGRRAQINGVNLGRGRVSIDLLQGQRVDDRNLRHVGQSHISTGAIRGHGHIAWPSRHRDFRHKHMGIEPTNHNSLEHRHCVFRRQRAKHVFRLHGERERKAQLKTERGIGKEITANLYCGPADGQLLGDNRLDHFLAALVLHAHFSVGNGLLNNNARAFFRKDYCVYLHAVELEPFALNLDHNIEFCIIVDIDGPDGN